MHNTPPIFQQVLDSICPPADTLWRADFKARNRRFAAEPVRITAMCPLDDGIDDRRDEEHDRDLFDEAQEWKADHVRDMGEAA